MLLSVLEELHFEHVSRYIEMSRELNRETGTWMPLYTDDFIFSSPWEWMQPGAAVDYAHALDAALRFDEGTHERVLASHWGNPVSRRSEAAIRVDTRRAAPAPPAAGIPSTPGVRDGLERSSMCVHATSAWCFASFTAAR